jgi:hypothetical protein
MDGLYPDVGMSGAITAKEPFDKLFTKQARYECIAVESINALVSNGEAPYEWVYRAVGASYEDYTAALAVDDKIITFQAVHGDVVKIPAKFLISMPDANGVKYSMVMLGVNLSAIPEELDLTSLKEEISDLVMQSVGVPCEVKEMVYGATSLLTHVQHRAVQSGRTERMATSASSRRLAKELSLVNEGLKQKVKMLEDYIRTNTGIPIR